MNNHCAVTLRLVATSALFVSAVQTFACCAVTRDERAVVNADQTVIMIWDEARQTQHFIRQASFKSDAPDVGFIVPTPSRPELAESGDEAFPRLKEITAPQVVSLGGFGIGCAAMPSGGNSLAVRVIEEKRVAGFDATVLAAASGADLAGWLRDHGYSYSTEVAAWAHPYVTGGWMMTALKVAKPASDRAAQDLKAGALRLSFKTARPLFPYREPASAASAGRLGVSDRLLRIYFIGAARFRGEIEGGKRWSGRAVWSGDITPHRRDLLAALKLPPGTGPATWWLTEFEDRWPYAQAAGDVYFSADSHQGSLQRKRITACGGNDAALLAFAAVTALRPLSGRRRNRNERR